MKISLMQVQLILLVCILYLSLQLVDAELLRDQNERDIRQTDQFEPKKRPFCNAFTGCGRKKKANLNRDREINNQQQQQQQDDTLDDSIGSLLDLNSEPAVEDLMRQIMSEAKIWEAIQEANREVNIQKFGKKPKNGQFNIAFSSQR